VREAASREKERAETLEAALEAALEAQRAGKRGERLGSWRRRLFGR
jgi:hypothetical protein